MRHLQDAAAELPPHSVGEILTLNNGPAWRHADAYVLYDNNVFEQLFYKEWESPAGLGICPLDIIFQLCETITNWLTMAERNFVVRPGPRPPAPPMRLPMCTGAPPAAQWPAACQATRCRRLGLVEAGCPACGAALPATCSHDCHLCRCTRQHLLSMEGQLACSLGTLQACGCPARLHGTLTAPDVWAAA